MKILKLVLIRVTLMEHIEWGILEPIIHGEGVNLALKGIELAQMHIIRVRMEGHPGAKFMLLAGGGFVKLV